MNPIFSNSNQTTSWTSWLKAVVTQRPFLCCLGMLLWSECVFRVFVLGKLWGIGLLYIFLFSAAAAWLCPA